MMVRALPSPVLLLLILLFFQASPAPGQDVDCDIQVNYEQVATTNKDLLQNFTNDVKTYVNNYKWRTENVDDKLKCTLQIFVKGVTGENTYTAQAFVGSSRPIFGQDKSTGVVRIFDESWDFTYIRSQPLNHNIYEYDNLTSFLDYYMYLLLGFDDDTYDKLAGTKKFQLAADIASMGRSSGDKGWQLSTGSFNRTQLIEEILNPKFEAVRLAIWSYHYTGLDSLAFNPEPAYRRMLSAVRNIGNTRSQVDPRNLFIRVFFDTKYKELADVFQGYADQMAFGILESADPGHVQAYEEARNKKK